MLRSQKYREWPENMITDYLDICVAVKYGLWMKDKMLFSFFGMWHEYTVHCSEIYWAIDVGVAGKYGKKKGSMVGCRIV